MPYKYQECPADMLLHHNGVGIYRTYKNDDVDNPPSAYWFVTDPYGSQEHAFDARELPGFHSSAFTIDGWRDIVRERQHVLDVIIAAIDAGIITQDGVKQVVR